jgi:hypothetical protein
MRQAHVAERLAVENRGIVLQGRSFLAVVSRPYESDLDPLSHLTHNGHCSPNAGRVV